MTKVVLASSNSGKLRELRAMLTESGLEIKSQVEYKIPVVQETGASFVENAIIKARNACRYTNLPAIADDSGLTVDFLQGQPGLRSARYAGETATDQENLEKLLRELKDVGEKDRTARFQCAIVFLRFTSDPAPLLALGTWEGKITTCPRGDLGFGYDPIFLGAGLNYTSAELDPEQKNLLSHRGKALRQLINELKKYQSLQS